MIRTVGKEEMQATIERNWEFVEPGFIVDPGNHRRFGNTLFIAQEKRDDGTLHVIPLTQENIFLMLAGKTPSSTTLPKDVLLNVRHTKVTDSMCREREGLQAFCKECRDTVYTWRVVDAGTKNYRVGEDGFCRHLDCSDTRKHE